MKVMLVNGSPNREGCTYVALRQIQKTLKEENIGSDIYRIGHKDIRGCIDCRKCSELGKCVFDDEVNSFVEKADEYDGYIFGGPVYYGTINPTLTNFMTRAFFSSFFWRKKDIQIKTCSCSCKRQKSRNNDSNRYNQQVFHLGRNAHNQLNILERDIRHKC